MRRLSLTQMKAGLLSDCWGTFFFFACRSRACPVVPHAARVLLQPAPSTREWFYYSILYSLFAAARLSPLSAAETIKMGDADAGDRRQGSMCCTHFSYIAAVVSAATQRDCMFLGSASYCVHMARARRVVVSMFRHMAPHSTLLVSGPLFNICLLQRFRRRGARSAEMLLSASALLPAVSRTECLASVGQVEGSRWVRRSGLQGGESETKDKEGALDILLIAR